MSVFKCKMCGGTIEFNPGDTIGVCDSCGTKQTLPRLDSDRKANLYDRANHFRRNNEFDKAMGIYESILNEDPTDAEAYWSLVLCRFGIEYVEDPATRRRVPTVNRAQYTSIFDDEDYKSALKNADALQRSLYEDEAKTINEIQKGILEISAKEEPFDVFICYKETDANGRRTPDSVLATDLYHQLTNEGFKVFFSRITLEDKLGQEYEPYIFAALNSAKAMVVLGTKPEHFNAVWVKNEWSRYLALIKAGAKKTLIPAYRDMDPYDLPEEFSHLQAQDMSKLGFMQDLIRGIKKIIKTDEPKPIIKETVVTSGATAATAPLLRRAFMFLEDGNWQSADEYCEKVLDLEPENAEAYLGKLMAELKVRTRDALKDLPEPFNDRSNFKKAYRFGDEKLKAKLSGDIAFINERNENARLTGIYNTAVQAMNAASTESAYKSAAAIFKTIPGFKDADVLAEQCLEHAEVCRKDAVYANARTQMTGEEVGGYESAIRTFQTISGWKDADEQVRVCQRKIEEIKSKEEAYRLERERNAKEAEKKRKRTIAIVAPIIIACIAFVIVLYTVIIPKVKLNKAMDLLDSGDYETAYALLEEIGNNDAIASSKYDRAVALINSGDYEAAYALLEEIGNNDAIASSKYDRAVALIDSGDYEAAYLLLNGLDYKDSTNKLESIKPHCQRIILKMSQVGDHVVFGSYEQDNNISNGKEDIEWLVLAREGNRVLVISRYALDCQQYHSSWTENATWETCSLRKWLNGTFFNNAFNADEQAMIQNTIVTADKNPSFSTSPGNNTTDKVFLLSITEAKKYVSSDNAQCQGTAYCYAQGAFKGSNGNCLWFLRSPGANSSQAASVQVAGVIVGIGSYVDRDDIAVRPALWINLG